MLDQEKILHFLQVTGPTLPSKVAKNIKTDIIIASAHLSDLASQGKVKISSLKIGGSPLYYLLGQEDQLYQFAQGNINAKDNLVLETLKEDRILREQNLDLLSKVALRNLKDFAVPLHVTVNGQKELFWKWHLLPDEETNSRIKASLFGNQAENTDTETLREAQSAPTPAHEPQQVQPQPALETPARHMSKDESEAYDDAEPDLDGQTTLRGLEIYGKQEHSKKENKLPLPKTKPRGRPRKKLPETDDFVLMLENFFAASEIKVEEKEIVRNNAEVDLLIKVPSVVGEITYFCKAKNKARCDEKDVSSAYMEAQIKKLPLLFLYKKEVTKKAQEMLDSGAFQNVILKRWE